MKTELVRWELSILLENKSKLNLSGREVVYDDQRRIEKLRDFLDSEVDSKPEQTEEKTTTIPF